MRFFKTPQLVQTLLPGFTWRKPKAAKNIYLTFDDGPIPGITEFVLAELAKHKAKATFFCVGDNIRKHPEIAFNVAAAGHCLGNHTHHHLSGWQTPTTAYQFNVAQCETELARITSQNQTKLFRPPYGRLTPKQYFKLKPHYQIIMWEVLTYDFDAKLSAEACLKQAIKNTEAGSIVVFHDSLKASRNLQFVLPRYLAYFANQGYCFKAL